MSNFNQFLGEWVLISEENNYEVVILQKGVHM